MIYLFSVDGFCVWFEVKFVWILFVIMRFIVGSYVFLVNESC